MKGIYDDNCPPVPEAGRQVTHSTESEELGWISGLLRLFRAL